MPLNKKELKNNMQGGRFGSQPLRDSLKDRFGAVGKKSRYLHSKNHLLADELSKALGEPKRFGFYLKMAIKHNHHILRRIAGRVIEAKAKKPGALFAYLVKNQNNTAK